MAKLTCLQLVNRILPKISQSTVSDVSAVTDTSKAGLVLDYINEAQTFLLSKSDWYSLYKMRRWSTATYTDTVTVTTGTIAFVSGDTITDSASAFVTQGFQANQDIIVSGADNSENNGLHQISTVIAGTITLSTTTQLVNEVATGRDDTDDTRTIMAVTFPVASDHGRTIQLMDTTNNNLLIEDDTILFDAEDPDLDHTGTPRFFAVQGSAYRLSPIPDGDYAMVERYWKVPDTLATNAATSDLPIECENLILLYAEMQINEYLREFERADRLRAELERQLKDAMVTNKRQINNMRVLGSRSGIGAGRPGFPVLPDTYDRRFI